MRSEIDGSSTVLSSLLTLLRVSVSGQLTTAQVAVFWVAFFLYLVLVAAMAFRNSVNPTAGDQKQTRRQGLELPWNDVQFLVYVALLTVMGLMYAVIGPMLDTEHNEFWFAIVFCVFNVAVVALGAAISLIPVPVFSHPSPPLWGQKG